MKLRVTRYLLTVVLAAGVLSLVDVAPAYASGSDLVADEWASVCADESPPTEDPDAHVPRELDVPLPHAETETGVAAGVPLPTTRPHCGHPARAPPFS